MQPNGEWSDAGMYSWSEYFLCQGKTLNLKENGLTTVELKKEQLIFFPLQVLFRVPGQIRMLNSSDEERIRTGLTINWFIKDKNGSLLTEKLPPRAEDWKPEITTPKYEEPWLDQMVQLAKHLRLQNMTRDQIMDKVITTKLQNTVFLENEGMCSLDQVRPEHLNEVFSKLVLTAENRNKLEGPLLSEDVKTGFEIFHAIVYCPSTEVIKLFRFIDQLISSETSRTIIRSMVSLFQSGVLRDKTSFTLARKFYLVLATILQLEYGNVLLATSTKSQLQTVIDNDWPFLTNYTDLVKKCLKDFDCDIIRNIIKKQGFSNLFKDHHKSYYY